MASKKLTKTDVLHVAKLSNLTLTDNEIKKFTPQLDKIVDFISQLSEVNTDNTDSSSQTTDLINIFRKDEVNTLNMLSQDKALFGTDNIKNGLIKVPKILEGRTDK